MSYAVRKRERDRKNISTVRGVNWKAPLLRAIFPAHLRVKGTDDVARRPCQQRRQGEVITRLYGWRERLVCI